MGKVAPAQAPILKFDGGRVGASALVPKRTIFEQLREKSAGVWVQTWGHHSVCGRASRRALI